MADSKSGQMEMPQLDQGLSPLGENDSSYPLPYFTDSKEQRYTSLLMKLSCIKPDHGVENISDNLVKEPPDSSAFLDEYLFNENNLRRVALLLKHIINLDELDQFVLFLDALREDTSTQTCSLFGKAETQFSELCERAKTMLESLKSKDERFPDLVTEIGVILDIFNNMKQNMTKKRGFFETTLSVQDNLVKCSDYMSLILDAKSLIEANNCLLAIYRINHIKTQLHLLQLPEKLTNLIVEYLFILQEDAQKKSKKSLKNFVENSHVLCRTIAEKISPDNKSNPCAFHEVELHPYVSSERDAPLFIEGCNFRNGKTTHRIIRYRLNVLHLVESVNLFHTLKKYTIFWPIYTELVMHEYMQEMQKIESTADSVQKICQFTYLVDLTTAYIVREASIRRFLSRIGYSYDVESLAKRMINSLIDLAVPCLPWNSENPEDIAIIPRYTYRLEDALVRFEFEAANSRRLSILCTNLFSPSAKNAFELNLLKIIAREGTLRRPFTVPEESNIIDYINAIDKNGNFNEIKHKDPCKEFPTSNKKWIFPFAIACFKSLHSHLVLLNDPIQMKHKDIAAVYTCACKEIEDKFCYCIDMYLTSSMELKTLSEVAKALVIAHGFYCTYVDMALTFYRFEALDKIPRKIMDLIDRGKGIFMELITEKIDSLVDMIGPSHLGSKPESKNSPNVYIYHIENFLLGILEQISPLSAEFKREVSKKTVEYWFGRILDAFLDPSITYIELGDIDKLEMDLKGLHGIFRKLELQNDSENTETADFMLKRISGLVNLIKNNDNSYLGIDDHAGLTGKFTYGYEVSKLVRILNKLKNSIIVSNPDDEEYIRLKNIDYILGIMHASL